MEAIKSFFKNIWNYFVNEAKGELLVSLLVMLIIAIFAIILGNAIKKAEFESNTG